MATKSFTGTNVFMSRNLVPPELFDSLHDALKQNGANVHLCCNPTRNALNDYHIIASLDHEKFEDLRAKGCKLLGPQCVLSCAKEHRALPKQDFTCCLAMDGVKLLASGFEPEEKVRIHKLVNAMGGTLHTKASLDISFVIVKNVLAAKYKWALNTLKKPIVTINWLHQCWNEHRVVPQESYRVLPFCGLTICVTRFPADERKEMEKIISQNGGKYSAELNRKCTHLISDVPEGDKYKVALRWGHIHIVSRRWFDQSLSRRACLNEDSYPVQGGPTSSLSTVKCCVAKHNGDKGLGNSQSAPFSVVAGSTFQGILDPDLETTLSQNICSADASVHDKDNKTGMATTLPNNETSVDGCVADDSQTEDNDLYLSECRILVVGFEAAEMRKLVNLVRRGGGSRYMSFNEKLTHIVVGNPSEIEKKEVRCLSALGVINVVKSIWLEDCERQRKEIPVLRRHIADDLLLPKDAILFNKRAVSSAIIHKEGKGPTVQSSSPANQSVSEYKNFGSGISMEKSGESKLETNWSRESLKETSSRSVQQTRNLVANDRLKNEDFLEPDANSLNIEDRKASSVFKGLLFQFSNSFPEHRRAEVVEWVNQGGGEVVDDLIKQEVHYTVECHGLMPRSGNVSNICVSTHWIRSCIKDGRLLDVGSHILYSPLPCQIPLPGFESFRFCVSQYEERERNLLRNLCFVLGSKYADTLSKKATHLICKFTTGPKYEAACKRGIKSVTSEWIYACVKQNQIVDLSPFFPKEATMQDHEAGFCTVSQYPTQAARMLSNEDPSQLLSQTQNLRNLKNQVIGPKNGSFEEVAQSSPYSKKARLSEHGSCKGRYPSRSYSYDPINGVNFSKNTISEDIAEVSPVPDVAAAIEDLLEQTSKIQDLQLPERTACDKSVSVQLSSSDCSTIGQDHVDPHPSFMLSKHWLNRTEKKVDLSSNLPGDAKASVYDTYNETPTESQVVSYEEDLSGRQMIIDRVRTQSSRPAS